MSVVEELELEPETAEREEGCYEKISDLRKRLQEVKEDCECKHIVLLQQYLEELELQGESDDICYVEVYRDGHLIIVEIGNCVRGKAHLILTFWN
jgi:hypothetical protein